MYHGDSSPQDQGADVAMRALYQQLDDDDLPADTSFNTAAGRRDLTHRIQTELGALASLVGLSSRLHRLQQTVVRCSSGEFKHQAAFL